MSDEKRYKRETRESIQRREHETSLIWAMHDAGYNEEEIANQLKLPVRTIYIRLGYGSPRN